jgi:hypothetical protein
MRTLLLVLLSAPACLCNPNSDARLILTADFVMSCNNWTVQPPAGTCTTVRHPWLWKVDLTSGAAGTDIASKASAALYTQAGGTVVGMRRSDGALSVYGHINATSASLVELAMPGKVDEPLPLTGSWNNHNGLVPPWLSWALMPTGKLVLLSFERVKQESTGGGAFTLNVTLYVTSMDQSRLHIEPLYTWSNMSGSSPPPPADKTFGDLLTVDETNGLLYTTDYGSFSRGAAIRVFDLTARTFQAALPAPPSGGGGELMCLHFDKNTSTLGAVLYDGTTHLQLISIDAKSGHRTSRLTLPDVPDGLSIGRRANLYEAVCSFSEYKGMLALQLEKLDPAVASERRYANVIEVHVLAIDVRAATAMPPMPIKADLPPPTSGETWRLVLPTLKFSA